MCIQMRAINAAGESPNDFRRPAHILFPEIDYFVYSFPNEQHSSDLLQLY